MAKTVITPVGVSLFTNYMDKSEVVRNYPALSKEYEAIEVQCKRLEKLPHTERPNSRYESDINHIAERISRFPEVRSAYLMSGTYDLLLFVEGKNLRQVASFVSERLSPLEGVLSTSTHFMLKTYKRLGVLMHQDLPDERLSVSP